MAAFIIGFHTARIDNIIQTIRFLTEWHYDVCKSSELLTICQNSCEELQEHWQNKLQEVLKNFPGIKFHANLNLPCMQLPAITNFGVRHACSDEIVVLESDRILPLGYFRNVITRLRPGIMVTTKKILKLKEAVSDEHIRTGQYAAFSDDRSETNKPGSKNMWSGNTAFMKEDYLRAGGMDERYKGYGWADCDMTNAMTQAGVESVFRDETELHLWHPPQTYGEGDQKQMYYDNANLYCKKWNVPLPHNIPKVSSYQNKIIL